MTSRLFAVLVLLFGVATRCLANVPIILFQAAAGLDTGYREVDDATLNSLTSGGVRMLRLGEDEVPRLVAGEVLLVTERMPAPESGTAAWAIALTTLPKHRLNRIVTDIDRYGERFPEIKNLRVERCGTGQFPCVVGMWRKSGIFSMQSVLRYEHNLEDVLEWRLATEEELLQLSPEAQADFRKRVLAGDYRRNEGSWQFLSSDHPRLRGVGTTIVLGVTVELKGFKARVKTTGKLRKSLDMDLPQMISNLIKTAKTATEISIDPAGSPTPSTPEETP